MSDLTMVQRIDFTTPSETIITSGYQGQWLVPGNPNAIYPSTSGMAGAFQIWTEGNRNGTAGFTPDATNNDKLTVLYGKYRARTDRFNGPLSNYDIGTKLTINTDGDLEPVSGSAYVYAICIGEGTMTYFSHNSGSAFNYIEYVTV